MICSESPASTWMSAEQNVQQLVDLFLNLLFLRIFHVNWSAWLPWRFTFFCTYFRRSLTQVFAVLMNVICAEMLMVFLSLTLKMLHLLATVLTVGLAVDSCVFMSLSTIAGVLELGCFCVSCVLFSLGCCSEWLLMAVDCLDCSRGVRSLVGPDVAPPRLD